MAKYEKYAEYKDSGVEWLGQIPSHWEMIKLKWKARTTSGSTPTTSKYELYYENGDIPWIRTTDLNNADLYETPISITAKAVNDSACSILPINSVLIAMYGGAGSIGKHSLLKFESAINQAVCGILPSKFLKSDYLHRYYEFYRPFWMIGASGTRKDPNIGQDNISESMVPYFSINEQIQIANFLDHETVQIDTLITKQEKLIELLKEKRQAVISHAVTKGLNPDVSMKDSGVEWLGQVPEKWMISRLGYETWIRARLGWKGLKADEYVDDGYIFLATPNIKGEQIDFNNVNYINQQRYEESPEIKLNVGDVLLTKDGSTLGTVNIVRDLPKPATVNSSIAVITPYKNLTSEFLLYLLKSNFMVNTIQRIKGGMGVPHLFQADLNKFYLAIPDPAEQFEIVKFLDQEISKIDTLISKAQSAIQLMQERRTALISSAVTGKIDVRNWQLTNNKNEANTELGA